MSIFFETFPYRVNETTGIIDYDAIAANAELYRPKLIVAGSSSAVAVDYMSHPRVRCIRTISHEILPHTIFLYLHSLFRGVCVRASL